MSDGIRACIATCPLCPKRMLPPRGHTADYQRRERKCSGLLQAILVAWMQLAKGAQEVGIKVQSQLNLKSRWLYKREWCNLEGPLS